MFFNYNFYFKRIRNYHPFSLVSAKIQNIDYIEKQKQIIFSSAHDKNMNRCSTNHFIHIPKIQRFELNNVIQKGCAYFDTSFMIKDYFILTTFQIKYSSFISLLFLFHFPPLSLPVPKGICFLFSGQNCAES